MKKNFMMMLAAMVCAAVMTSCNLGGKGATVYVHVESLLGTPVANEVVYKYSGDASSADLASRDMASKAIATDENGVAEFSIKNYEFIIDDQATFIFETFDKDNKVSGKVAVTVSKGNSKEATLTIGKL